MSFLWILGLALLHEALSLRPLGKPQWSNAMRASLRPETRRFASTQQGASLGAHDVAILGAGPAGMSLAYLLQSRHGLDVALIDPKASQASSWYPNYGEWRDEWHTLTHRLQLPELRQCTTNEWEHTDVFLGDDHSSDSSAQGEEKRTRLSRPYVRVDRVKMQRLLRDGFLISGGRLIEGKVSARLVGKDLFDRGIVHLRTHSELSLDSGGRLSAKVVVDASGLETRRVAKEDPLIARGNARELPVGFQIAYGFLGDVDNLGPYDETAMTLFDYRTGYAENDPQWLKDCEDRPTFIYAMPLSRNADGSYRVFMEETSLVGRGPRRLSFAECKRRALSRLAHHGMKLLRVEEEEYCYIPMGGELPDRTQRVIAFGGAANLVHPSTGYHVCRMLAAAPDLAQVIADGVRPKTMVMKKKCISCSCEAAEEQQNSTSASGIEDSSSPACSPEEIARNAYQSMWSDANRQQRDFQVYGGDFFMDQNVHTLRDFFRGFFSSREELWAGFLGGWPGLPHNEQHDTWQKRVVFAATVFCHLPNRARFQLLRHLFEHVKKFGATTVLRSLSPPWLFKAPELERYDPNRELLIASQASMDVMGDEEAKEEARRMMKEFESKKAHGSEGLNEVDVNNSYPSPFGE